MNPAPKSTKPVIAPYFSFVRATWIACVVEWDRETGEFECLEGFQAFESYHEALEASRVLARTTEDAWAPDAERDAGAICPSSPAPRPVPTP